MKYSALIEICVLFKVMYDGNPMQSVIVKKYTRNMTDFVLKISL